MVDHNHIFGLIFEKNALWLRETKSFTTLFEDESIFHESHEGVDLTINMARY